MDQLEYTCDSSTSPGAMTEIMDAYLSARASTPNLMQSLLKADPNMPMAHCAQGYFLKLAAHPKFASAIEKHRHQAASGPLNRRESLHITALNAWIEDDVDCAIDALEEIADTYPSDLLALRIAHYLHFYNGAGPKMHASTGKALDSWDPEHPLYGYLLGMHAFGLEENGHYGDALAAAEAAVALNVLDTWAIHAADHVFYMTDQHREGIQWLEDHAQALAEANNFRNHLHWHQALHHLKLGTADAALQIYDRIVEPSLEDDFYLDFCNAVGLLVRLEQAGVDTGERWSALKSMAAAHAADTELVFASLHYLIAMHRTEHPDLDLAIESLVRWGERPGHQAGVSRDLGAPLMGAIATRSASFDLDLSPIGGSKAQRELFSDLLSA